jgi:hypothetical protein
VRLPRCVRDDGPERKTTTRGSGWNPHASCEQPLSQASGLTSGDLKGRAGWRPYLTIIPLKYRDALEHSGNPKDTSEIMVEVQTLGRACDRRRVPFENLERAVGGEPTGPLRYGDEQVPLIAEIIRQ